MDIDSRIARTSRTRLSQAIQAPALVQRTEANHDEVNIYKSLARFPHLKHLTVELDCPLLAHDNPYGSKSDRDSPVNTTKDEALVRSILAIILDEPPCFPLQSFGVVPLVPGRWHIVSSMHKDWELWRPEYSGEVIVTRATQMEYAGLMEIPEDIASVFSDLWPVKSDHWTNDW
ncbi:uncharacterized protein BDV17DRAFT_272459 [Aspergillus undulatus]|uniref:uncharacterized protein n=1 Tax=Aspergillus undulatus TaxID=1810928 RepID=UPI003CCD0606